MCLYIYINGSLHDKKFKILQGIERGQNERTNFAICPLEVQRQA